MRIAHVFVTLCGLNASAAYAAEAFIRIENGGHVGGIRGCAFADAKTLVTASDDKSLRVWDVGTGTSAALRYPITDGFESIAFSLGVGGGKAVIGTLAKEDSPAPVYVFDLATRRVLHVLREARSVAKVAVSPAGDRLAVVDGRGVIRQYDLTNLKKVGEESMEKIAPGAFRSMAYSRDGRRLAFAAATQNGASVLAFLDPKDLHPAVPPLKIPKPIYCLDYGDRDLAFGGAQGTLGTCAEKGIPRLFSGTRPEIEYQSVAWTADGNLAAAAADAAGSGSGCELWSSGGRRTSQYADLKSPVTSTAAAPGGSSLAFGSAVGVLRIIKDGRIIDLGGTGRAFAEVAWTPDSQAVAWKDFAGNNGAFDLSQALLVPPRETAPPRAGLRDAPTLRIDGDRIATSDGRTLKINPYDRPTNLIALRRDLAVGVTPRYGLALWRMEDGRELMPSRPLRGLEGIALSVVLSPDDKYIAAACTDQRIRIWRVSDLLADSTSTPLSPILTLHATAAGEWALWNEQKCFYAASPQGDEILGIQVNRNDLQSDFAPARTQRETYYRPDVVKAIFASGSVEAAMSQTGTTDTLSALVNQEKCPTMDVLRVAGARLEGGRWIAESAEVKIVVRVAQQIETVRIAENNLSKSIPLPEEGAGTDRREIPVTLLSGLNRISLVAQNRHGESGRITVPIEFRTAGGASGRLNVLAIGVSGYNRPGLSPLPFNESDASAIAELLKAQNGKIGPVDVRTLLASETTGAGIRTAVTEFLAQVKPEDNVLIFISAHGMAGKDGQYYLMPLDAEATAPHETGIAWKWVLERLQATNCRNAILVQDTCHSAGARYAQFETIAARNMAWRSVKETNLVTFSSSQPNELSYVSAPDKHSVFTLALLRALKGQLPTVIQDGYVWLDRMDLAVRDEVQALIAKLRKDGQLSSEAKQVPSITQFERAEVRLAAVGSKG